MKRNNTDVIHKQITYPTANSLQIPSKTVIGFINLAKLQFKNSVLREISKYIKKETRYRKKGNVNMQFPITKKVIPLISCQQYHLIRKIELMFCNTITHHNKKIHIFKD